jgi:hypothetical protein
MRVTDDVSQPETSPVKLEVLPNIVCMFVTADVFQPETLPAKLDEYPNVAYMLVTDDVSQPERSSEKLAIENNMSKFVTFDTHHEPMGHPYISARVEYCTVASPLVACNKAFRSSSLDVKHLPAGAAGSASGKESFGSWRGLISLLLLRVTMVAAATPPAIAKTRKETAPVIHFLLLLLPVVTLLQRVS